MYTKETIGKLRAKYKLKEEIDYTLYCNDLCSFENKNVLQVGGSLPEELVINDLRVKSWSSVEFPGKLNTIKGSEIKNHKDTILNKEKITIHEGFGAPLSNKYNVFLSEIHKIPESHNGKYDIVFSINAFNQILHFTESLEAMHNSLVPGGKLFSLFSPLWSSCNGHDIYTFLPELKIQPGLIPPWGHLVMKISSMYEHLSERFDRKTASEMVYHIYHNPAINRFYTEDYLTLIKLSSFEIEKFDTLFNQNVPPYSQKMLEQASPGCKSFGNSGLFIVLSKQ